MLAALCALPISFMATPAQAQYAEYCNGALGTSMFFTTMQSTDVRSTVSYMLQLQNRTASPVRYSVRFTVPGAREAQNGYSIASLSKYQQVTILLGRETFHNPSGKGQMATKDVARHTKVVCPPG